MSKCDEPVPQAAVIPVRRGEVCLVTARGGKRWVAPKGRLEKGLSPRRLAALEAWEEAGLRGRVPKKPLGVYHYRKNGVLFRVRVYLMLVSEAHATWPESADRRRRWLPVGKAARRLKHRGLRKLVKFKLGKRLGPPFGVVA